MLRNIWKLRFAGLGVLAITIIYLYLTTKTSKGNSSNASNDKVFIWCTFSRVKEYDTRFKTKFSNFLTSLKQYSDVAVSLNVIIDDHSENIAKQIVENILVNSTTLEHVNTIEVAYHNINAIVMQLEDMIETMKPFFTSGNDTYYGNALFYISLGLHQVVPHQQKKIMLLDVDVQLRAPISRLYQHFYHFGAHALFGLSKELSPVYYHILQKYRKKFPNTHLGLSAMENGNQGFNSGVLLMDIEKLRHSNVYKNVTKKSYVQHLSSKYSFVGHLGDQDFYTLLSFEHPEIIYTLPCQWNRALCQWWKFHGYRDVFYKYFHCPGDIFLYHGNCNTPIPIKEHTQES